MEINNLNLQVSDARIRPRLIQKCPRCNSMDTKFCYYNNYSLNQPRHYCKTCRRYWTQGGTCRNIPIGGSSNRRNRRPHPPQPNVHAFARRRRKRPTNAGSVTVCTGGHFPNELETKPSGHAMSCNNVVNLNNVAPGFETFPQLQPPGLVNGNAWRHQENLSLASSIHQQNDNMFFWRFDCTSGSGGPLPHDMDFINDQWFQDLPGCTHSPPLLPPQNPSA